MNADSIITTQ